MAELRIAGVIRQSIADGPGLRFVVFAQGCPHRCPGCHNPDTHDLHGGSAATAAVLLEQIDANPLLKGITLSGGEPFLQAQALVPLVRAVRERGLDVVAYTGFLFEDLLEQAGGDPFVKQLLELTDVLVDGPYLQKQRDLTLRFRGSRNQRVLDLPASLAQGRPVPLDWDK